MANLILLEVKRNKVIDTNIVYGQVLYCTDTKDTYYDTKDILRIQLTTLGYCATEAEKAAITSPIANKLYYVKETNKFYLYDTAWIETIDTAKIDSIVSDITLLVPGTLNIKGVNYSPRTLTTTIYNPSGQPLEDVLTNHVVIDKDNPISKDNIIIGGNDGNISDSNTTIQDLQFSSITEYSDSTFYTNKYAFGLTTNYSGFKIFGGMTSDGVNGITEEYLNFVGVRALNNLNVSRAYMGSNSNGDTAYAVGGIGENDIVLGNIEFLNSDKDDNIWTLSNANLITARKDITLMEISNYSRLIVAGGIDVNNNLLSSTEYFDPYNEDELIIAGPNLNIARSGLCSTMVDNLIIGGTTASGVTNSTEKRDMFDNNLWKVSSDLNIARTGADAISIGDNSNLKYFNIVVGGATKVSEDGMTAIELTDSTEKWNGIIWSMQSSIDSGTPSWYAKLSKYFFSENTYSYSSICGFRYDKEQDQFYISNEDYNILNVYIADEINKKITAPMVFDDNRIVITDRFNTLKFSNKTFKDFEIPVIGKAVWKTDSEFNNSRYGISSSTLSTSSDSGSIIGGENNNTVYNNGEDWDGYTWSTFKASMNAKRSRAACTKNELNEKSIIITGGLSNNGVISISTEAYDGMFFISGDPMIEARAYHTIYGSDGTMMITCGENLSGLTNYSIMYKNYTWSVGANTLRINKNAAGNGLPINSALMIGGTVNSNGEISVNNVDAYNGTTWRSVSNLIVARQEATSVGVSNDLLVMGGRQNMSPLSSTEKWNGTTWEVSDNILKARAAAGSFGKKDNCYIVGGSNSSNQPYSGLNTMERYYQTNESFVEAFINNKTKLLPEDEDKIVSVDNEGNLVASNKEFKDFAPSMIGIWSAGPNTLKSRAFLTDAGTKSSGIIMGGIPNGRESENWDGLNWSSGPSMPLDISGGSGSGTRQTPFFCGGKTTSELAVNSFTLDPNTGVWITKQPLLKKRTNLGSVISNSGARVLAIGGNDKSGTESYTNTEVYSEEVWSASSNLLEAKSHHGTSGDIDYAMVVGGTSTSQLSVSNTCYISDGIIWLTSDNSIVSRLDPGCQGTTRSTLLFGGDESFNNLTNTTEYYNSYVWKVVGSMIVSRKGFASLYNNLDGSAMAISGATVHGTTNSVEFYRYTDFSKYFVDKIANPIMLDPESANMILKVDEEGNVVPTTYGISDLVPAIYQGWYVTGEMLTARRGIDGVGDTLSALTAGGVTDANVLTLQSELFDGAVWSVSGNLLIGRYNSCMCGTVTDALIIAGSTIPIMTLNSVEIYKDGLFKSGIGLTVGMEGGSCIGIVNDALLAHGNNNTISKFNGVTWSSSTPSSTKRQYFNMIGNTNNCLIMGGQDTKTKIPIDIVEGWNGTVWSTISNLNVARSYLSGAGLTGSVLAIAGSDETNVLDTAEYFDSHIWSIVDMNMNQARKEHGGTGYSNLALAFGGTFDKVLNITEKYNRTDNSKGIRIVDDCNCPLPDAALSARQGGILSKRLDDITITVEADPGELLTVDTDKNIVSTNKTLSDFIPSLYEGWASSSSIPNTNRHHFGGSGSDTNNAIIAGGYIELAPSKKSTNNSEVFKNNIWSNISNILIARHSSTLCGTELSAMIIAGNINATVSDDGRSINSTELYNNNVWKASVSTIEFFKNAAGVGIVNNILISGLDTTSASESQYTRNFNGTSWSGGPSLLTQRRNHDMVGVSNSALVIGGSVNSQYSNSTELLSGNVWKVDKNLNQLRSYSSSSGNVNNALTYGGLTSNQSGAVLSVEYYNSFVWSIASDMNQTRIYHEGTGNGNSLSLAFGGLMNINNSGLFNTIIERYSKVDNSKGILIVDNCDTQLPDAALSANQGNVLAKRIEDIAITVEADAGELLTVDANKNIVSTNKVVTYFGTKAEVTALQSKDTAQDTRMGTIESTASTLKNTVDGHTTKITAIESKNTSQDTKISAIEITLAGGVGGVKVIQNLSMTSSLWSSSTVSGFYYYDIINNNIKSTNVVNINFTPDTIYYAEDHGIAGVTESFDGKVRIFCKTKPPTNYTYRFDMVIM